MSSFILLDKEEFDSLYKKTMQSKSADVVGRSWVVYQWLSVKHVVDPNYQNLFIPSFFEFRYLLYSATKTFSV
jgi:hypothetical protein